jgi:hypothetical protein
MTKVRTKVVAYATVIEEMFPLLPQDMTYQALDFGLLRIPEKLRSKLQEAIDVSVPQPARLFGAMASALWLWLAQKATACTLVVLHVRAFPKSGLPAICHFERSEKSRSRIRGSPHLPERDPSLALRVTSLPLPRESPSAPLN